MRTRNVLAALLVLSGVAAAAVDPTGDDFGDDPGSDLVGVSACRSATTLTVRLDFAAPITPPPGLLSNAVYGFIDIDVDRDAATGVAARTDDSNPGGALSGLGVDLLVQLFDYDAETGTTMMRVIETTELVPVPVVFAPQSLTVTVPLPLAEAPGDVGLAAVVGNIENATDVAPNAGAVVSEPCCGNGALDAGEDCDDGSACCTGACLFADGAPCGGDACAQEGTCAAGACTGAGAPRDCDDGDPCFDDGCAAPGGCVQTDRTGIPGAACAFERALPAACAGAAVRTKSRDKAGTLVTRAASASGRKQKALLRKARQTLKTFGKQVAKLARRDELPAACAGGLQAQASDAISRIDRVLAGG